MINHVQPATGTSPQSGAPADQANDAAARPQAGTALAGVAANGGDHAATPELDAAQAGEARTAEQGDEDESKAEAESDAEKAEADEIRKLQARDTEVRAHEQAHAAAGGAYAGAPSFEFEQGPDGRRYAVSGEVPIDISSISGDPEATIAKMQQVKRAALAPESPSGADRSIAATADAKIVAARGEISAASAEKTSGSESGRKADPASEAPNGNGDAAAAKASDREDRRLAQPGDAHVAGDTARGALGELRRRNAGAAYYAVHAPAAGGALSVVS